MTTLSLNSDDFDGEVVSTWQKIAIVTNRGDIAQAVRQIVPGKFLVVLPEGKPYRLFIFNQYIEILADESDTTITVKVRKNSFSDINNYTVPNIRDMKTLLSKITYDTVNRLSARWLADNGDTDKLIAPKHW